MSAPAPEALPQLQAVLSRFGQLPPDAWAHWAEGLRWRDLAAGVRWEIPGQQAHEVPLVTHGLLM